MRTYRNDQPGSRGKTRGFAVRDQAASKHAGDRSVRARLAIVVLAIALCLTALFSLTAGASDASVVSVMRALVFGTQESVEAFRRDHLIIMEIRLPRIVMGILVGAALAVSGAVMQGLSAIRLLIRVWLACLPVPV